MSKPGPLIFVVDPEPRMVRILQSSLGMQGYTVLTAKTGQEALEMAHRRHPDLLLVEWHLPDMSGLEVCHQIQRQMQGSIPLLLLSERNTERDKVKAFDEGIDDYITKPFSIQEVLARVRVALRWSMHIPGQAASCVCIGPLSIDVLTRCVLVNGQQISLTPTEFELLKVFVMHPEKVLTREMLTRQIWGAERPVTPHRLHVQIALLRKKIEPMPSEPHFIRTIPGVGYRFCKQEEEHA